MGSTALGGIVAAQPTLEFASGDLVIVSDDPRIVRVLTISGLDRTLRMRRSLNQAVNELAHAGAAR